MKVDGDIVPAEEIGERLSAVERIVDFRVRGDDGCSNSWSWGKPGPG